MGFVPAIDRRLELFSLAGHYGSTASTAAVWVPQYKEHDPVVHYLIGIRLSNFLEAPFSRHR